MDSGWLIWTLLALPAAGAGICLLLGSTRTILRFVCAGVLATAALAFMAIASVIRGIQVYAAAGWFCLDELSAYHLAILMIVYLLSSLFAVGYFKQDAARHHFTLRVARRFGALWFGALWSMILVLASNNLGILWVGIEATTLLTAFLICIPVSPTSLEAMWKYLIMCSVGVAFAFIGTLLVGAAASPAHLPPAETLLWTRLQACASLLDPRLLKAGFLFLMVGYGTKAGLAPMHNWLPDAHSQAPAPVSAVFSGILLNVALYCILRYVPILEAATGYSGWSREILILFGLVSILVASAFIIFQHNAKRMLAYHSVEHIGIITLGMGIGGLGTLAALFHMLNHSLTKTVAFFTAGRLGQLYGSNDMTRMGGALRTSWLWGGGLFVSMLALIGVAPFAIFMSEFQLLRASLGTGSILTAILFLGGTAVVFVGALRHITSVVWGNPVIETASGNSGVLDRSIVVIPLAALLILGLWMPSCLWQFIRRAAAIVGGGI
jgi:hydrogenase-4 component F